MTLHVWTSVTCDAARCKEAVVDNDRKARQIAAKRGWILTRRANRGVDLCPMHKYAPDISP